MGEDVKTITIAMAGSRQKKDMGTLRVKIIPSRTPVNENNQAALEILDALNGIKKIPDISPSDALSILRNKLNELDNRQIKMAIKLALNHYPPSTRALLGMLLDETGIEDSKLKKSLNPSSRYKIGLNCNQWQKAREWHIS
ncbi:MULTISPECIES: hypothetical protein [Photorhabdus]|uniref:Uncharacterized protein n=2 Tax=Photorhabdus temperata TaxID=574560 RepID=A0A081RUH9_PHOTE|nr:MULTISPECIES: hypothetical protein [Photorhabdus]KER02332.1 hypothetical protein MEG1DRAFT_03033 [Photorhabdus temperata subsp. temperata Meg1]MCC8419791.1 hypothetical protein [Photorhabdus thracensis]MCT8348706.1 hypothetical protein [Photorhabdus temperata]